MALPQNIHVSFPTEAIHIIVPELCNEMKHGKYASKPEYLRVTLNDARPLIDIKIFIQSTHRTMHERQNKIIENHSTMPRILLASLCYAAP